MIPVLSIRCLCGKVVGNKAQKYEKLLAESGKLLANLITFYKQEANKNINYFDLNTYDGELPINDIKNYLDEIVIKELPDQRVYVRDIEEYVDQIKTDFKETILNYLGVSKICCRDKFINPQMVPDVYIDPSVVIQDRKTDEFDKPLYHRNKYRYIKKKFNEQLNSLSEILDKYDLVYNSFFQYSRDMLKQDEFIEYEPDPTSDPDIQELDRQYMQKMIDQRKDSADKFKEDNYMSRVMEASFENFDSDDEMYSYISKALMSEIIRNYRRRNLHKLEGFTVKNYLSNLEQKDINLIIQNNLKTYNKIFKQKSTIDTFLYVEKIKATLNSEKFNDYQNYQIMMTEEQYDKLNPNLKDVYQDLFSKTKPYTQIKEQLIEFLMEKNINIQNKELSDKDKRYIINSAFNDEGGYLGMLINYGFDISKLRQNYKLLKPIFPDTLVVNENIGGINYLYRIMRNLNFSEIASETGFHKNEVKAMTNKYINWIYSNIDISPENLADDALSSNIKKSLYMYEKENIDPPTDLEYEENPNLSTYQLLVKKNPNLETINILSELTKYKLYQEVDGQYDYEEIIRESDALFLTFLDKLKKKELQISEATPNYYLYQLLLENNLVDEFNGQLLEIINDTISEKIRDQEVINDLLDLIEFTIQKPYSWKSLHDVIHNALQPMNKYLIRLDRSYDTNELKLYLDIIRDFIDKNESYNQLKSNKIIREYFEKMTTKINPKTGNVYEKDDMITILNMTFSNLVTDDFLFEKIMDFLDGNSKYLKPEYMYYLNENEVYIKQTMINFNLDDLEIQDKLTIVYCFMFIVVELYRSKKNIIDLLNYEGLYMLNFVEKFDEKLIKSKHSDIVDFIKVLNVRNYDENDNNVKFFTDYMLSEDEINYQYDSSLSGKVDFIISSKSNINKNYFNKVRSIIYTSEAEPKVLKSLRKIRSDNITPYFHKFKVLLKSDIEGQVIRKENNQYFQGFENENFEDYADEFTENALERLMLNN